MKRYHVRFVLADMPVTVYEVYDRETDATCRVELNGDELHETHWQPTAEMLKAVRDFRAAKDAEAKKWMAERGYAA